MRSSAAMRTGFSPASVTIPKSARSSLSRMTGYSEVELRTTIAAGSPHTTGALLRYQARIFRFIKKRWLIGRKSWEIKFRCTKM